MRARVVLPIALVLALVLVACGDDDGGDATDDAATSTSTEAPETTTEADPTTEPPDPTTTEPEPEEADPLLVLVTNDDGIGAPGIDAMVEALATTDAEIVIVAPAENQSGSSDTRSDGEVTWSDSATTSGAEATAVDGTPADAVLVALDELGIEPDLVVSGINDVFNVGPLVPISGTVGAARTALRQGIPAVAISTGMGEEADFSTAARVVLDWIDENGGDLQTDFVVSINTPNCTAGEMKGVIEVPVGADLADDDDPFSTDCTVDAPEPETDALAIEAGYASLSLVPADL
jgi:5'-nucleotidase